MILMQEISRKWGEMGHFRITSGLIFEASLGAHPFICKSIFIHTQIKLIFMWMKFYFAYEKMSTKTRFEKEAWGNSEMANLRCLHKIKNFGTALKVK